MINWKKIPPSLLLWNGILVGIVCILNYFYQKAGFYYPLKCACSVSFALQGLCNARWALRSEGGNKRFYIYMTLGVAFAMLGDVGITKNFVIGAALFAVGHVFFVVAYSIRQRWHTADLALGGCIFVVSAALLLLLPVLAFEVPAFRAVCVAYAVLIAAMTGKAITNFTRTPTKANGTIALGSVLFYFSDSLLVLDWFSPHFPLAGHACMALYYPALCILAFSILLTAAQIDT